MTVGAPMWIKVKSELQREEATDVGVAMCLMAGAGEACSGDDDDLPGNELHGAGGQLWELNDHDVANNGDSDGRFTSSMTTKGASSNLVTSVSVLSTLLPAGTAGENGCGGSFCNIILGCGSGCFCLPPLGLVGVCIATSSEY
ncbi:hypothetical protein FNV43_RR12530 [Rhamnella rubrinervis]|uniref:Uncharacterized protein n=1 Tax=Rhamnella rubrinervis TaxID=2594499 RepID=A0A8K0H8E4_9ROSA|nr:hypothetical protein FNV43_RR12530 [Rhamnella rubrinervis]